MSEGSGRHVDRVVRAIIVVAALYFAQSLILPVVLAVLIAVALNPVVRGLHRRGLPHVPAVVLCVLAGLGVLGTVAWQVGGQMAQLARRAPEFRDRIVAKTQSLGPVGVVVRESFEVFQESLERAAVSPRTPKEAARDSAEPESLPQRIEDRNSLASLWNLARSLFGAVGQAILILILLILFLVHQEDLGDRLLRVLNDHHLGVSRTTFQQAGQRISKYLLTEAGVNAVYGLVIGAVCALLQVPQPVFWGVLAALFRFIPYIGTWMVAAMALLLSIAGSPTWTSPALLLGCWLVLEILAADVVEPWIYGRRTGITAVGVMVSALFWSWLWGVAGLMIATPITACLAEFGTEIPGFRWLNTLFSTSLPSTVLGPDDARRTPPPVSPVPEA